MEMIFGEPAKIFYIIPYLLGESDGAHEVEHVTGFPDQPGGAGASGGGGGE